MTKQTNIGKEVFFDKKGYEAAIDVYTRIIPVINAIAAEYEVFSLGSFSQEVYNEILLRKAETIKARYDAKVLKSIDNMQIPSPSIRQSLINQAANDIKSLSDKTDKMFQTFSNFTYSPILANMTHASLENISIIGNRAAVDDKLKDLAKSQFTTKIETENQSEVYRLFVNIKEEYDKLQSFLTDTNNKCDILLLQPFTEALLDVDENGYLQFKGQMIDLVK